MIPGDVLYEVEKMARRIIAFETEDNSAEMLKRSLVSDNYDPQLSEAIADLWVNTIAKKVAADPDAGKKSTTEEVTSSSPSERDTHRECLVRTETNSHDGEQISCCVNVTRSLRSFCNTGVGFDFTTVWS